jgi:hypothetical protein
MVEWIINNDVFIFNSLRTTNYELSTNTFYDRQSKKAGIF